MSEIESAAARPLVSLDAAGAGHEAEPDLWLIRRRSMGGFVVVAWVFASIYLIGREEGASGLGLLYLGMAAPLVLIFLRSMISPQRFLHLGRPRLTSEIIAAEGPPPRFLKGIDSANDLRIAHIELLSQLEQPKKPGRLAKAALGVFVVMGAATVLFLGAEGVTGALAGAWFDFLLFTGGGLALAFVGLKIAEVARDERKAVRIMRARCDALSVPAAPDGPVIEAGHETTDG